MPASDQRRAVRIVDVGSVHTASMGVIPLEVIRVVMIVGPVNQLSTHRAHVVRDQGVVQACVGLPQDEAEQQQQ